MLYVHAKHYYAREITETKRKVASNSGGVIYLFVYLNEKYKCSAGSN